MNLTMYCGEKGKGKTSFIQKQYPDSFWLEKADAQLKTYGAIEATLLRYKKAIPHDKYKLPDKLKKLLKSKKTIVIDNAELITEKEYNLILNSCTDKDIIIIFDLKISDVCMSGYYLTASQLHNVQLIDYDADKSEMYSWIKSAYVLLDCNEYDKLIKISGNNYNNIIKIMGLNNIGNQNNAFISEKAIKDYANKTLEEFYKKISDEYKQTLEQSSVIGETFALDPLKHNKGFNQHNAKQYLEAIENLKLFIQSRENSDDEYNFIDNEIHKAVYDGIPSNTKSEWIKILKNYFFTVLEYEHDDEVVLRDLHRLLQIGKEIYILPEDDLVSIYLKLMDTCNRQGDILKTLEYAENLFFSITEKSHYGVKQFVYGYIVKNYINIGSFDKLTNFLKNINSYEFYDGSTLYSDYYRAQALYNNGDIDEAFNIIQNLLEILEKHFSKSNVQKIHCLVYSLAATIWEHLQIDDRSYKFYSIALNSSQMLTDKTVFYDILKKSSMFEDYTFSYMYLKECIDFYSEKHMLYQEGEACFNLGTDILFNEGAKHGETKHYLTKAHEIFKDFPNEKYAYAKNNLALYYIMVENNAEKAYVLLNEAAILGLSAFTYMTIYQNMCECLILLGKTESEEFLKVYEKFNSSVNALSERQHSTRYENAYKTILDILVCEHTGKIDELNSIYETAVNNQKDKFFKHLITDIYSGNNSLPLIEHSSNLFYHKSLNDKKIFLSEFRFWE